MVLVCLNYHQSNQMSHLIETKCLNHLITEMSHLITEMSHLITEMSHLITEMSHLITEMSHLIRLFI